ncbi:MAG: AbrB/MazE/SpoVT family DNA-binding domain-containing protein [Candidatus Burarchaeum sp.]|nr:AbrB/MazE/SpoVT family DNA-binding domain-containing protein [Candidatus Burarchaeum sp.]MDO8339609.1 AbrB/MazE/SpoVT family DNA-binding domain-containing protein [Candidatus Burarchaeum sp.]
MEGKLCGICDKGRLHAYKDEITDGIYVDAYKCDFDPDHVSYTAEVMHKVEAIQRSTSVERHLVKVGSSVAAPIPSAIVKALRLKPRGRVFISAQGRRIIIRPAPS